VITPAAAPVRVALATYAALPDLDASDRRAADALRALGADARAEVWDDPAVRWESYDVVVVRSCWDYQDRVDEFATWIERVASLGVRLWNPAPLLRWNMDKRYLRELESRGVRIAPTAWVDRGSATSLESIAREHGWDDVVVKPVVSANGRRTWRATGDDGLRASEAAFASLVAERDVMVQRFMPEIARDGEWSLVFIAGAFSHAVRKRPRPGEFRVQSEHGGEAFVDRAPGTIVDEASSVVGRVPWPWLYARVDGCATAEGFVLMELEMLESSLFLNLDDSAAERFARALMALAGSK
jgi:glutathione synthase/RimK-type ligase-like ATP-grasp enzyme